MKTAILTTVSPGNFQDVVPWMRSLHNTNFQGKIIVIMYDENAELVEYFRSFNCYVLTSKIENDMDICAQRYRDYVLALSNDICNDVDLAIHTDCHSTIFQRDPEQHLKEIIGDYQIVAAGEGVTFRHDDRNGDNIQFQLGKSFYDELIDQEALSVGVIAGRKGCLIDLFNFIYKLMPYAKSRISSAENAGVGNDQLFYNVLLRKCYKNVTLFLGGDNPWVANLNTLISIPMQNPQWSTQLKTEYHFYERFRKGTFIDNMLVDLPILKEKKVYTANNELYSIIHQYTQYKPWEYEILGYPTVNDANN